MPPSINGNKTTYGNLYAYLLLIGDILKYLVRIIAPLGILRPKHRAQIKTVSSVSPTVVALSFLVCPLVSEHVNDSLRPSMVEQSLASY